MTTLYFLMVALALTGQEPNDFEHSIDSESGSFALQVECPSPSLDCPDDITVVIDDMSCTKDVTISPPPLPGGFSGVYEVFYDYQGISPGIAASSPPDGDSRLVSGEDTTVTLYGGTNLITYTAIDADDTEYCCSYTITVLDGVPPVWPDDEPTSFEGLCGLTDAIEVWENNEYTPIDNCCNTKNQPAEIHSVDTICGNEVRVTLFVLGGDGSGDPVYGGPSEFPCITSFGPPEDFFADTLWITVDLIDTVPPEISGVPANDTISCSSIPNVPSPTASDICGGDLTAQIQLETSESDDVCGSNGDINRITTYTWTVDDGCGNIASASWKVYFQNSGDFEINVTGGGLECSELSRVLDAGAGGDTYTWSTGENTQIIEVSENGVYRVTVTSVDGCCAIDSAQVTFGDEQVLQASGGTITCVQSEVQLDAGIETDMYTWTGPNGFMSSEQSPIATDTGEYIIVASSSLGCNATDTVRVEIDTITPDVEASFGAVDCQKLSVQLIGSSATEGSSFLWTGPNGFESENPDTTAELAGTYVLTVTAPNGCTAERSLVLGVPVSRPVIQIGTRPAIDNNNGIAWVDITGGQAPYDIEWFNGEQTDTITMLSIGKYSVTVTDANNCVASREFFIDPANTICDLSVTGIGTNSLIKDTLSDASPYIMYNEPCIESAFNDPTDGSLYIRTFLFEKNDAQSDLTLKVRTEMPGSVQAFVFTCELSPDFNRQACLLTFADSAQLDLANGYYYMAIVGTGKLPYEFIIEETNDNNPICRTPATDISCGALIEDDLAGVNEFSVTTGAYGACYRGDRVYDGPENVYRLEVKRNSVVTFTLNTQSPMGVFIYDFQCTGRCISTFETFDTDPVQDAIILNKGFYYVVVDQAVDMPGKSFTLNVDCTPLSTSPWPPRRMTVCYDSSNYHTLKLDPKKIKLSSDLLDPQQLVTLYLLDPTGEKQIGQEETFFLTEDPFDLLAFADKQEFTDTCGYLEDEPILFRIRTGLDVIVDGKASFDGDTDSIAFEIGAISQVDSMTQREETRVSVSRLEPAEIKDVPHNVTETRLSVQCNQTWRVDPRIVADVSWIDSIYIDGSSNPIESTGPGEIVIKHQVNPRGRPRGPVPVNVKFLLFSEVLEHQLTQSGDPTVGVTTIKELEFLDIYPNPTSRELNINMQLKEYRKLRITLSDVMGKMRYSNSIAGTQINHSIDLSDLPSGVYILTFWLKEQRVSRRVIVTH